MNTMQICGFVAAYIIIGFSLGFVTAIKLGKKDKNNPFTGAVSFFMFILWPLALPIYGSMFFFDHIANKSS